MPKKKKVKFKKKKMKKKIPKEDAESVSEKELEEELFTSLFEELEEEVLPKIHDEGKEKKVKEEKEEEEEDDEAESEEKESVILSYRALNKVLRHGMRFSNPKAPKKEWIECMGFLVGDVIDGNVEISDAIPMVHGSIVEVEFQNEHYAKADEINQSLTNENWIVGWYHTHPGHGLFLSPVDRVNHSGYQSLNPKAVAMVFDPSKFKYGSELAQYLKIFRLKSPELGEKSEFIEIKGVEIKHYIQDVLDSMVEATMLLAEDYPLVLEFKEDYKKPKPEYSDKVENLEKDIVGISKVLKKMHKEVKILHNKLEDHFDTSEEEIKEMESTKRAKKPKQAIICEFCGYDSIMPGDSICANCGMTL
jgi:proteasome lid subunit RPN8/RPN11